MGPMGWMGVVRWHVNEQATESLVDIVERSWKYHAPGMIPLACSCDEPGEYMGEYSVH